MDQLIHNPYANSDAQRSHARLLTASETEEGKRNIFCMLASGNSTDLNVPTALWQAMDSKMRDKLVELCKYCGNSKDCQHCNHTPSQP